MSSPTCRSTSPRKAPLILAPSGSAEKYRPVTFFYDGAADEEMTEAPDKNKKTPTHRLNKLIHTSMPPAPSAAHHHAVAAWSQFAASSANTTLPHRFGYPGGPERSEVVPAAPNSAIPHSNPTTATDHMDLDDGNDNAEIGADEDQLSADMDLDDEEEHLSDATDKPEADCDAKSGWENLAKTAMPDPSATTTDFGTHNKISYNLAGAISSGGSFAILAPDDKFTTKITKKGSKPPRERKYGKGGKVNVMGEKKAKKDGQSLPRFEIAQVGDRITVIEDRFGVTAYASDVTYVCHILTPDLKKSLFEGDYARAHFDVDHHIASLEIVMGMKGLQQEEVSEIKCILRFPAAAIDAMEIFQFNHPEHAKPGTTNKCFAIALKYKLGFVCSENIFVQQPEECLKGLVDYMKSNDVLWIHVCGSEYTVNNFNQLYEAFLQDKDTAPLTRYVPEGKGQFVIQKNEFMSKDDRPEIQRYHERYSYFSYDELIVINCFGPLDEYEYTVKSTQDWQSNAHEIFFCKLLGGGDRGFLGLLKMPADDDFRLSPGDVVHIFKEPKKDNDKQTSLDDDPAVDDNGNDCTEEDIDPATYFGGPKGMHARVSEPIPGLPSSLLPLVMSRPWNKETGEYEGFDDIQSIEISAQDKLMANLAELQNITPTKVWLSVPIDHNQYKHRVTGLAAMVRSLESGYPKAINLKRLLVGNETNTITSFDIFTSILDVIPQPEKVMKPLNQGQQSVVTLARAAPAGVVNVHGPPGTGKTHTMGEISRPFIIANKPGSHILATSASNHSTDALACRFQVITMESGALGQYTVRVHSLKSETEITMRPANMTRPKPDDAKPNLFQLDTLPAEEKAFFDELHFASSVATTYARQYHHFLEMVSDARVTEASWTLSLGTRVLQLIGEIPAGKGDPVPDCLQFGDCRELYRQYKTGEEFDKARFAQFRERLQLAQQHVLEHATVIVTTPAMALDPKVNVPITDSIKLIMVDESARLAECDVFSLIGHYPNHDGLIMVGDPMQLPPTVLNPSGTFSKQYGMSLPTRLLGNGTPSAFLDRQYRMSPKISEPLNKFAYQGRLKDDESVLIQERPILNLIENHHKELFNNPRYMLLVDVQNTETGVVDGTGSKYNPIMAQFCFNLTKTYLEAFPKQSVAIICFYNAQYLLYLAIRDRARVKNRMYERLNIIKADSVQGVEFDITVTDFTIGSKAGFLAQLSRLVVATSRAKIAAVMVMDKGHADNCKCRVLRRLFTEYVTSGKSVTKIAENGNYAKWRQNEFYSDDLVDFKTMFTIAGVDAEAQDGEKPWGENPGEMDNGTRNGYQAAADGSSSHMAPGAIGQAAQGGQW